MLDCLIQAYSSLLDKVTGEYIPTIGSAPLTAEEMMEREQRETKKSNSQKTKGNMAEKAKKTRKTVEKSTSDLPSTTNIESTQKIHKSSNRDMKTDPDSIPTLEVPNNLKLYENMATEERNKKMEGAVTSINSQYSAACSIS